MAPGPRRRVLWTGVSSVLCVFLCSFFLVPVYPTVSRDLGVGPDLLGLLVGGGQLFGAALQIPAGLAADRFGRRPFLVGSLATTAACQVLRWAPGGVLTFGMAQAGVGLCLPLIVSSSSAAVADAYAEAGRAQALGMLLASANVGQVLGYLVTGQLAGWLTWRQVSLALTLPPALLTILAFGVPEPSRSQPGTVQEVGLGPTLRFLIAAAPASLLAVVALAVAAGNSSTYLLPFVDRGLGLDARATSFLLLPYVAGSVVLAPLTGRVADRRGARPLMLAWSGTGALAAAGFAFLGPRIAWMPLCYVLLGGTTGSLTGLAAARMAELASRPGGPGVGAALGGLRSTQSLGPALGPPLAGLIYVEAGFRPAFLILAAELVAAFAAVAVLAGRPLSVGQVQTTADDVAVS
ncbi:MAG TPA: MFS transporter [Candidatus Dormibacteraeota bacterium]|nr:MFS transporter [Candidatus Dormibacteraeota bacterium]